MLKDIDLTNKCGSCDHFKPIENTAAGECLQHPYDDSVVHDPKHPHWIVQRSKIKCQRYNAKPQTNADSIRSMSDEELARMLSTACVGCPVDGCTLHNYASYDCEKAFERWLQQPWEGE